MMKYSQMWTLLCLNSVLATVKAALKHRCKQLLLLCLRAALLQLIGKRLCTTPSGDKGTCIPLKKCSSLVKSDSILFDDDLKYLKLSENGCNNNKPLVCCGLGSRSSDKNEQDLLPTLDDCLVVTSRRIVGGNKTDEDEFPWSALLSHDESNSKTDFHCGGVLINKRYVLTAAHCIVDAKLRNGWDISSVRMGEYNLTSDQDCYQGQCADQPVDIKVEETTVHENYNMKTKQNDIALIRLLTPIVTYTKYIKPLCLPLDDRLKSSDLYDDTNNTLVVAGWGKTEKNVYSDVKLKVTLPGVSNEQCNSVFQNYKPDPKTIYNEQLCAGGVAGHDSCNGDSGGALMATYKTDPINQYWYCAGIVSFGRAQCGTDGFPGVYTRVSSYTDWILRNIRP